MKISILALLLFAQLQGAPIKTNQVTIDNPPSWLTAIAVQEVTDQVQKRLEWSIRRIKVKWYHGLPAFRKAHGFKKDILAFAERKSFKVHMGPAITPKNFKKVFAHELAHVVIFQKWKGRIPKWLDEGLANYAADYKQVDYNYLKKHKQVNILKLTHPFSMQAPVSSRFHYMVSLAAVNFLASKCSIRELLNLALRGSFEKYIKTFCNIPHFNKEFWNWVQAQKNSSLEQNLGINPNMLGE